MKSGLSTLPFVAAVFAFGFLCSATARANAVRGPSCADGNLFVGARASGPGVTDRLGQLADGRIAPEGATWPDPGVLVKVDGELTLDLGSPVPARRFFVQIDADQRALVGFSADGSAWEAVSISPDPSASGMISRVVDLPPRLVRYVRLLAVDPPRVLALTELALYCDANYDVNSGLRIVAEHLHPGEGADLARRSGSPMNVVKLIVVLLALGAAFVARRGRRVPVAVVAGLAMAAVGAYADFGAYHDGRFVHDHDVFHYFIGAKYFPSLGYDLLYDCASIAEAEAGFPQRVGLRPMRDLRTDYMVAGTEALRHTKECHRAFSEVEWHDFVRDVRVFANASVVSEWIAVLKDHGFNASPAWIAPARALSRRLRASSPWVIGWGASAFSGVVPALDPLLLALAFGAAVWGFGIVPASFAAIVFACNPLAEFSWIGGGFLRQLWFASLVIALALLRRRQWALGGAGLGIATALQLFPVVCLAGVAALGAVDLVQRRRVDARVSRVLAAGVTTLVLLAPLSAWGSGRSRAWSEFVINTRKHAATPSGNLVGLPAALSFRMSTRASVLYDVAAVDAHAHVRQARIDNYRHVRPLHWFGIVLGLWLFMRLARRRAVEPWELAVFALALVPFCLEVSSYYTEWLSIIALAGRRAPPTWLVILGTVTALLALRMFLSSAESDVLFARSSWILVGGVTVALACEAWRRPNAESGSVAVPGDPSG